MEVRPKKKAGGLWAGRLHHWDSKMHICAGGDDERCQLLERRAYEWQRTTGRDVLARLFVHMQHRHDWRVRAGWQARARVSHHQDSACTHNIWGSSAGLLSLRTGHSVNVIRISGTIKAQCEGGHANPAADEIYVCPDVKMDLASAP